MEAVSVNDFNLLNILWKTFKNSILHKYELLKGHKSSKKNERIK